MAHSKNKGASNFGKNDRTSKNSKTTEVSQVSELSQNAPKKK